MSLAANQQISLCVHAPAPGEGEGGGKGGEKISAARAGGDVPNFPGGASRRTAGGCAAGGPVLSTAILYILDFKTSSQKFKKVNLQSGTVRDNPGHQLS